MQDNQNDSAIFQATYIRCASDLQFFAKTYFPHYCDRPFNLFHKDCFEAFRYNERAQKNVWAAPRGSAKSTFKAVIEICHDIAYGVEDYIVIISNTDGQSKGKLKDIRNELLTNERFIADYQISFPNKKPAETSFVVHSKPFGFKHETMLSAFGSGAEIRGIRFREKRPSKIVCDDIEHSEKVFNEEIREKNSDYYYQVVSKIGNRFTNIQFVGTILHRDSLLTKLLNNPAYSGKVFKSIISWSEREDLWAKWREIYTQIEDPDRKEKSDQFYRDNESEMLKGTEVIWPEYEDYQFLMKEMIEIGRRAFMKEKQNEPLGAEDKVFENIHWYREVDEGFLILKTGKIIRKEDLVGCYGALDPATGQTKAKKGKLGDYSCLLTGYEDRFGRVLVHDDWTKRAPPSKYIKEIFEKHEKWKYTKFGVETNLYRNLLIPNIIDERTRRQNQDKKLIKIPFYDIENTDNKEKRIFTLEPKVEHGWILFNESLSKTAMNQLIEFPHGDHEDFADCLEMLYGLIHKRFKPAAISIDTMGNR